MCGKTKETLFLFYHAHSFFAFRIHLVAERDIAVADAEADVKDLMSVLFVVSHQFSCLVVYVTTLDVTKRITLTYISCFCVFQAETGTVVAYIGHDAKCRRPDDWLPVVTDAIHRLPFFESQLKCDAPIRTFRCRDGLS